MRIMAVDDESLALSTLERALKKIEPEADVIVFKSSKEALSYARDNTIDVAFLDIEMPEINGLVFSKNLKDIHPFINIIFVTGYSVYALPAFEQSASGYILKPIREERVAYELENLRNPITKPLQGIYIQCFGNFEILANGKPVPFKRSKSKEALAYLVDRKGAGVSNRELASVLWEDTAYTRTTQSHLRTILSEMKKSLEAVGAKDIVINQYNSRAIDTTKVDCDFYRFGLGDAQFVNLYHGEYMTQYSWAEFTLSKLNQGDEEE